MHPALLGGFTASLWGVHDLLAGVTSRRIGFLPTVFGSTFFGLAVLTAWLGWHGSYPALVQDQVWVAYASGCGYALATLCLFAALSAGPMSLGVPLAGSYPVTSLALAAASGAAPGALQLSLALTVVTGVVIASAAEDPSAARDRFPDGWFKRTVAWGLGAHVMFALGIWSGQVATARFGTLPATWLARLAGFALLATLLAAARQSLAGKARYVPVVALLGVLDVLAISSLNRAGHTEHPEIATVIGSTFGPVTVLLAWLFLKERITALRWLGIVVTFSGVAALSAVT